MIIVVAFCLCMCCAAQIWDIRTDHSIRSIFGPHVCGDAVDIRNNVIVSGSWRPEDPLQLWDFGSGQLIETLKWTSLPGEPAAMLYAASFNSDGSLIAAGGSETNEARVYNAKTGHVVGCMRGLKRAVYSVDFAPDSKQVAIGSGDGSLQLCAL